MADKNDTGTGNDSDPKDDVKARAEATDIKADDHKTDAEQASTGEPVNANQQEATEENTGDPMQGMSVCMDKFHRTFEESARRWELVVYPSLLAFIILAAYGFYLIYKLTSDVDHITARMDIIAETMVQISGNMILMTEQMVLINNNMGDIDNTMAGMSTSLDDINANTGHMGRNIETMSVTMYQLRNDTAFMGKNLHNASGPMRFMNNFMPW
jgi:hypothetical protein